MLGAANQRGFDLGPKAARQIGDERQRFAGEDLALVIGNLAFDPQFHCLGLRLFLHVNSFT